MSLTALILIGLFNELITHWFMQPWNVVLQPTVLKVMMNRLWPALLHADRISKLTFNFPTVPSVQVEFNSHWTPRSIWLKQLIFDLQMFEKSCLTWSLHVRKCHKKHTITTDLALLIFHNYRLQFELPCSNCKSKPLTILLQSANLI